MIQRIKWPCGIFNQRRLEIAHGLEGPELPAFGEVDAFLLLSGPSGSGVMRTELHPFFENGDLAGRKLGLWRHFELRVHIADRFDDQTFL